MRVLAGVGLAMLLPLCALAQNRAAAGASHHVANTWGSLGGFGNVVYPGTGHAPGLNPRPGLGYSFGNYSHRHRAVAAYAYPVFVGGYGGYYGGYSGGYEEAPPPEAYHPAPAGPQVIINQNFLPETAHPMIREYGPEQASGNGIYRYEPAARDSGAAEAGEDSYYLIAFKDHSIYSAFAYWVDGDTLHYVTPQRVHNQASLNMVDRDLTNKLNHDRQMQVKLP